MVDLAGQRRFDNIYDMRGSQEYLMLLTTLLFPVFLAIDEIVKCTSKIVQVRVDMCPFA